MICGNRFKGLDLIGRVPEELWMEVRVLCPASCPPHPQMRGPCRPDTLEKNVGKRVSGSLTVVSAFWSLSPLSNV